MAAQISVGSDDESMVRAARPRTREVRPIVVMPNIASIPRPTMTPAVRMPANIPAPNVQRATSVEQVTSDLAQMSLVNRPMSGGVPQPTRPPTMGVNRPSSVIPPPTVAKAAPVSNVTHSQLLQPTQLRKSPVQAERMETEGHVDHPVVAYFEEEDLPIRDAFFTMPARESNKTRYDDNGQILFGSVVPPPTRPAAFGKSNSAGVPQPTGVPAPTKLQPPIMAKSMMSEKTITQPSTGANSKTISPTNGRVGGITVSGVPQPTNAPSVTTGRVKKDPNAPKKPRGTKAKKEKEPILPPGTTYTAPVCSCGTKVSHLKMEKGQVVQGCEVYIGRQMNMGGWNLTKSKWANPYKVGKDGNIFEVLDKYEQHIRTTSLYNELEELRGKELGCWCKPDPCHGDVLIKLLNETNTY